MNNVYNSYSYWSITSFFILEFSIFLLSFVYIDNRKNMEDNKGQENQIQIELDENVAQGTYANLAIISHSSSEFVIDFVRVLPGLPKAKVKSRIILTPENAKRLLFALGENITQFENTAGSTIKTNNNEGFIPPIGNIGEA